MTQRRPIAAAAAVTALVGVSIPLAAPGAALVPGAERENPAWLAGPYGDGFGLSPDAYLVLLYVAVAIWIVVVPLARGLGSRALTLVAGGLIAIFALSPPLLSLDVFSYISYARLLTEHGLNPYEFPPAAIPADESAMRVMDFRDAVSVYGPLFTLGSLPLGALGVPAALWSLKAIAALSIAGVAALTARLAQRRGVEPLGAAAFVGLNPLVLVHLVGGAHNDSLMVLLAMLGIAAALAGRPALAGAGLVAAVTVKAAAALYVPFAFLGSGERRRLAVGLAAAVALAAAVGFAMFGSGVLEAVGVVGNNQETVSHWSVPGTLARVSGLNEDTVATGLAVLYVPFVVGLLVWVARGADWVRGAGWAAFGLLAASAYMAPWYLIWLLPLAAISRDRALIVGGVVLTAFQAVNAVPI